MKLALTLGLLALTAGTINAQDEPAGAAAPGPAGPGPMDLFVAYTRVQLGNAGFERHEAEHAGRTMVWWEKGSGTPLVFLHGVADQAGTWYQVAPDLAGDHRVVLVDLPGHGDSAPADGALPMTTVIEGFEAWLTARDFDASPTLIGNSMGAWVAILAAHRQSERVGRIVMVNGGPLRADTGDLDLLPDNREEARQLMAALRDASSPPTPDMVLDDLVRRAKTGHVRRMFEAREALESYLIDDDGLGEIKTPVDILWGRSDRYMGEEYPGRLLAGLPRARLTYVEKCGHLPQAECPQAFLAGLRQVLAKTPDEPAPGPSDKDP